ncbi:uncharacterized protein LOC143857657 [Tasmannia lanceolata]|uniref:uncharacterized protein LOC143857657 n=1 Tax=Tasmannia lanceolata TaxID=3420 RepID=UPI00406496E6
MGKQMLRDFGAHIIHGVDATSMSSHGKLRFQQFDRIIYNFLHAGFHGSENGGGTHVSFEYGCYGNPTTQVAEKKISALEGAESTLLIASGICVPATVIDLDNVKSPTNPFLRCVDIELVSSLCHNKGALVCIDGTFASPVNQKALAVGADIVLHSVTKYIAGHNAVLEGFSDADWNTLSHDSKATTSYVFTIGGGAVSWRSKKQTIIAQSTMESELIALTSACEEATWLKNFLTDIPIWDRHVFAVLIHCDSITAIGRVHNKYYNGKLRQIRRKHSTVRELISNDAVTVDFVRSGDNLADPLTKALSREKICITSRG